MPESRGPRALPLACSRLMRECRRGPTTSARACSPAEGYNVNIFPFGPSAIVATGSVITIPAGMPNRHDPDRCDLRHASRRLPGLRKKTSNRFEVTLHDAMENGRDAHHSKPVSSHPAGPWCQRCPFIPRTNASVLDRRRYSGGHG